MKEIIPETIKRCLRGRDAHIAPLKALKGLTPEMARKRPSPNAHSCWELLYHIVLWQDVCLDAVRGNNVDWEAAQKKEWPSQKMMSDDTQWGKLVSKFEKGLKEASQLVEQVDLAKPIPAWGGAPTLQVLMVVVQHNSYHIGQIVATRIALGYWPPPKESE